MILTKLFRGATAKWFGIQDGNLSLQRFFDRISPVGEVAEWSIGVGVAPGATANRGANLRKLTICLHNYGEVAEWSIAAHC